MDMELVAGLLNILRPFQCTPGSMLFTTGETGDRVMFVLTKVSSRVVVCVCVRVCEAGDGLVKLMDGSIMLRVHGILSALRDTYPTLTRDLILNIYMCTVYVIPAILFGTELTQQI